MNAGNLLRSRIGLRIGGIEVRHVREKQKTFGSHESGHIGGKTVIVTETDLEAGGKAGEGDGLKHFAEGELKPAKPVEGAWALSLFAPAVTSPRQIATRL